jgi:PKD repeat protein
MKREEKLKMTIRRRAVTLLTLLVILTNMLSVSSFLSFVPSAKASGALGDALSFDGISAYVSVPVIDGNVYTFELWFNPEINNAVIGSDRFLIQTSDDSLTVWHDVYNGSVTWYSVPIGTGSWHHLAVIIDYNSWLITPFLDNVNLTTKATTTISQPPINFINIGCYWGNRFFEGLIDEVRIYERALSASEIAAHYNGGTGQYGQPETGLAEGWHFDEGSGATVYDYSGNGRDGTINEASFVSGHVPLPDVATTDVTPTPTTILTGGTVSINVTVKNAGAGAYENFTVTAYYDGNSVIGSQPVTMLLIDQNKTLTFSWNTAGVPLGTHTIKANATIVLGETETLNNENIDGTVKIVKPPVAAFTHSPVPAIENYTTTFDASSSTPDGGTLINYTWSFGDGNITSTTQNTIKHVYTSHGTYNVALTVEDSDHLTNTTSKTVQVLRHDVAVVDVTPYRSWIYEGQSVDINVTIANLGNFTESVDVDLYYNITANQKIGSQTVSTDSGNTTTLTFSWDTTDVAHCHNYTITAIATIAFDSDTTNNMLDSPTKVKVRILGDTNGDGTVDMQDINALVDAFLTYPEHPLWNPDLDLYPLLQPDGSIDMIDISVAIDHFLQAC